MKLKKISIAVFITALMTVSLYLASGADFANLDNTLSTFPFLEVEPNSASTAALVDQNYDAVGLQVDSLNARTNEAGYIRSDDNNEYAYLLQGRAATDGLFKFYRNLGAASMAGPLAYFHEDNANADENLLELQNDGEGNSLVVNNGKGTGIKIQQDGDLEDNQFMLHLENTYDWTGGSTGMVFINNDNSGEAQEVVELHNDGQGNVLRTEMNGNGNGVEFLQFGDGIAVQIDNDGDGKGLTIDVLHREIALQIGDYDDAQDEYVQIDSETTSPAASDCTSNVDAGLMIFEHDANLLWICKGTDGWGSVTIS